MKFIDGNWLTREGFHFIYAIQPYRTYIKDRAVEVLVAPKDVTERSAQLDVPLLTITFSSPMADVISVRIDRHQGRKKRFPHFHINEQANVSVEIIDSDSMVIMKSGKMAVHIPKQGNWKVEYFYDNKRLTGSEYKSMAHITGPDGKTYIREELNLSVAENIYGLGERFTHFVKNGQSVEIWNRDGGTSTEQAYKNIPFYLSNRGYGVFVNHPENVSFEVGSERVSKVQFSVEGESLHYFIIGGDSLKSVLNNYTILTGKPSLPPAWSFGLWLTTSFTTDYDEETVNRFVDGMLSRDIPLSVFHFDCFWMKAFHWCDFEWDRDIFPDPEGMIERLKQKGLKICVWINPYIAQRSKLFQEACEKGYLLRKENGDVWQWDKWQPGMGIVDFTNPEACRWYADHLRRLVDMGVDCFKTDFGERIPTDVVYYNGADPQKMHNYYTYLYNKVVYEVLVEKRGKNEAVLFARSATVGSQQFPVHWGGDCYATYESMAESLRGGLSLGLSGFGFWSHDIGGFENTASADLYKRWTAFGLLSSHSRLHGNQSYRVPWLFDEEAVDVTRFFTKLKYKLMPYIYAQAVKSANEGIPMMRAMVLEFSDDPSCDYLDRQYMFGDSLLVAPIFNGEGIASYYLPEGVWTHLLSNKQIKGGRWLKETYDYMSLPLFVRPNSIIAIGSNDTTPVYDYMDHVEFHVFELEDGKTASTHIYNTDGEMEQSVLARREGNKIIITAGKETAKHWSVVLRGIDQFSSLLGAVCESTPLGLKVVPKPYAKEVEILL
ncbi:alpha-xylosidase [Geobacillus sp. PK12]